MDKIEMLHELCGALFDELEPVTEKIRKGGMSGGDLETVDKMTHAIKSIKTVKAMMEAEEDGYSEAYMPRYGTYRDPRNGMSYRDGRSYARGRRNASRDSMGRYSGDGYSYADEMDGVIDEMRGLLHTLPEDKRRKAEKLMDELAH